MQATVKYVVEENFPELKNEICACWLKGLTLFPAKRSRPRVSSQNNLVSA